MANETTPLILPFATADAWEAWLTENHREVRELWLQIAKQGTGIPTVNYDEALDVALCYGWIDGQRRTHDAQHFIQRFTPRRPKGLWSRRNVVKVAALIDSGRMQSAGLAEIRAAQADGRWEAAYASQREMAVPDDLLKALAENAPAQRAFDRLTRTDRYAIALALHKVKGSEARARRIVAVVRKLAESVGS